MKDLETETGVTCTFDKEHRHKCVLRGSLASIQKAASYLGHRYKSRHEKLDQNDSEEYDESHYQRCKAVSGCDELTSGRKTAESRAAGLPSSVSEIQPNRGKTHGKNPGYSSSAIPKTAKNPLDDSRAAGLPFTESKRQHPRGKTEGSDGDYYSSTLAKRGADHSADSRAAELPSIESQRQPIRGKTQGTDADYGSSALAKTGTDYSEDSRPAGMSSSKQQVRGKTQGKDADYGSSTPYRNTDYSFVSEPAGLPSTVSSRQLIGREKQRNEYYGSSGEPDYSIGSRAGGLQTTSSQRQPFYNSDYGSSDKIETDHFHLRRSGVEEGTSKSPVEVQHKSYNPTRYSTSSDFLLEQAKCQTLTFRTPKASHRVSLYQGDLTEIKADAVVCSTDSYLAHGGGLAEVIARVGGSEVTKAASRYISNYGSLYPSNVAYVTGGKLPSKYVIYAVGPVWIDYKIEEECLTMLKETFMNCFQCATKDLVIKHIALPLISSGISGVPVDKCSKSLYNALMEFDESKWAAQRQLRIDIVDKDIESVSWLQTLFSEYLSLDNASFEILSSRPDAMHGEQLNGTNGYTLIKSTDLLDQSLKKHSPVVKDFPSEMTSSSSIKDMDDHEDIRYKSLPMTVREGNGRTEDVKKFKRSSSYEASVNASSSYQSPNASKIVGSYRCKLSFKTPIRCHLVSIYHGDLTAIKADAIVNAANSCLAHYGGVARAIADVGGYQIEKESKEYIQRWGALYPSKVIHTSGGHLPSSYVIHAVGPVWKEYKNKTECLTTLMKTFLNCFHYASNALNIKHIAVPLISSGIFGVPIDKCIKALYGALMEFDTQNERQLDIHIVDSNVESVQNLQMIFSKYLNSDNIPFDKTECTPPLFQKYQISKDISDRIDCYGEPYLYNSTTTTTALTLKSTQNEGIEKMHKSSSKEKDSSSKRTWKNLFRTNKSEKGMSHAQGKYKDKPSEFRVKENSKVSPTNGPMKALSNLDSEATLKKLLEDFDKRGNPVSEFRDIQLKIDILEKNSQMSIKGNRTKSLDRLPKQKELSEKSVSGGRQSRQDSTKTESNRRSQSLDRRKKETEGKQVKTRIAGKDVLEPKSTKIKQQKEENKTRQRSQSLDRNYQKTSVGSDNPKGVGGVRITSQHKSYLTRCSFCHGEENLRPRKNCLHMICRKCRAKEFTICGSCRNVYKTQETSSHQQQRRDVSASTKTTTDINPYTDLEIPMDSKTDSDPRKRRREKQSTKDAIYRNGSIPSYRRSFSQGESTGASSIFVGESAVKKDNIDGFLILQPPPVIGGCPICLTDFEDTDCQEAVSLKNCGHSFCMNCIKHAFQTKPSCPVCGMMYGCIIGNQPEGTMDINRVSSSLPGYPNDGTIIIQYHIPSGVQNESHPNPGNSYTGTSRTAYLPDTVEGRDICRLLKKAFEAKLTFTVGRSVTTGRNDTVTWNDIHHKTSPNGGPSQYGYPDDTYLERVRDELAAKGIS